MSEQQTESCYHCGLDVPNGAHYPVEIRGESHNMCCHGCQAVAQAIVDGGLETFYDHRESPSRRPEELVPEELQRLSLYDQDALQESFVQIDKDKLKTASLILEGITCAACVWLNERHVKSLPGVTDFSVNYSTHRARVTWDDSKLHLSDILKAISDIGYVAHPFDPGRQEQVQKKEKSLALRKLAIAGVGAMQVMMLAVAMYSGDYTGMDEDIRNFMRWVSLFMTIPVVFYSARGFFTTAWRDLKRLQLSMEVPVSIAIGGAFSASVWATVTNSSHEVYFDSVCMFAFFLLASRYLEMGARHRAGQAAEELVKLLPATATKVTGDGDVVIAVAELMVGDIVRVKPGETIPADGVIIEGLSSVDESLLTGESMPRPRHVGDNVVGGSINIESPIKLRIEKVGEDTLVSAIVRLLDRAQGEKPQVARVADKIAAWFVGGLLVIAVSVATYWMMHSPELAFAITLSVLVVTCPCALSLATPTAVTAATGALTKLGLLTTRGHALEILANATHIVFDKTGTLTKGSLKLSKIEILAVERFDEAKILAIAAALESGSEHPVARVLHAQVEKVPMVSDSINTPGQGIEGVVDGQRYRIGVPEFAAALSAGQLPVLGHTFATRVALADEIGVIAFFELSDELRPDAESAISRLQQKGLVVEILSGDADGPVQQVAKQLKVDYAQSAMRPEDKLAHVQKLQSEGARVVMIGDGVNDAPVLAGADVSIAMGQGAQLAHASSDMVILSERLGALDEGVDKARKTLIIIKQNLGWALFYNLSAVPLAALGWVAPWMAALGMSFSSLVVVFNALRLKNSAE